MSVYGYCPTCAGDVNQRERSWNGNDTCVTGHVYPSRLTLNSQEQAVEHIEICKVAQRLSTMVDKLENESLQVLEALGLPADTSHAELLEHLKTRRKAMDIALDMATARLTRVISRFVDDQYAVLRVLDLPDETTHEELIAHLKTLKEKT